MWVKLFGLATLIVVTVWLIGAAWSGFAKGLLVPAFIILVLLGLLVWRHLKPKPAPPPVPTVVAQVVSFPTVSVAKKVKEPKKEPETPAVEVGTLTHRDRCEVRPDPFADKCQARAFVKLWLPFGLEKLVCGHHANTEIAKYGTAIVDITDERHLILGS